MSAPAASRPTGPAPAPNRPSGVKRATGVDHRAWLLRAGMVLLIAGSVALLYWSMDEYRAVQSQSRDLNTVVARLGSEVETMERKYTQADVERLGERFGQAHEILFNGQDPVDTWLLDTKDRMIPLALSGRTDLGTATPQGLANSKLTLLPVTVSLTINPTTGIESRQTPYQRMLRFLQQVASQPKRADLVGLSVSADTNSVAQATARLELWAGEEPPKP